jgi:N-acetylglucosaminyl-diphospho-decaprenol L-rhamnosyltransferase
MTPDVDRPVVDVGVVTWNTRDLTVASLRRLLDGEQGCELRLLVRDNGSTDGTPEAVRLLVPEASVDAGTENLGFAGGVNTLLRRSDAPWFFALNSDAWPEPGSIARLVEVAKRRPRAAVVVPRLERPDGVLEHSTHPFPSPAVAAMTMIDHRRLGGIGRRMLLEESWMHDEARSVDWAVGAAMLMRRSAITSVGLFDERFFMYVEDLDWCWRARQAGWEVWFEPSALVRHVGNASGEKNYKEGRSAAYLRNTYRWYRRHHGRTSTVVFRGFNALAAVRLALLARLRHQPELEWYWREVIKIHLSPVAGPDGPPASDPS